VSARDPIKYRIEGLWPGTYSVTFTLPGFSTVKREGIELTGSFIATVNAGMRVGTLQEEQRRRHQPPGNVSDPGRPVTLVPGTREDRVS